MALISRFAGELSPGNTSDQVENSPGDVADAESQSLVTPAPSAQGVPEPEPTRRDLWVARGPQGYLHVKKAGRGQESIEYSWVELGAATFFSARRGASRALRTCLEHLPESKWGGPYHFVLVAASIQATQETLVKPYAGDGQLRLDHWATKALVDGESAETIPRISQAESGRHGERSPATRSAFRASIITHKLKSRWGPGVRVVYSRMGQELDHSSLVRPFTLTATLPPGAELPVTFLAKLMELGRLSRGAVRIGVDGECCQAFSVVLHLEFR